MRDGEGGESERERRGEREGKERDVERSERHWEVEQEGTWIN